MNEQVTTSLYMDQVLSLVYTSSLWRQPKKPQKV